MNFGNLISKYKNSSITFKATVWYTICNILQKLSAFLLIPFLTRMLSTDDYGIYTVFLSWLDIFEIFATMRMYSNGYMAGVVKNDCDQDRYTCSIQFSSIVTTTIILAVYHVFSKNISALVQVESHYLYLMFISYYATSSIGIWSARQRVNNKYKAMTTVTLCYGILAPLCSIIAAAISPNKLNAAIYVRIIVQCLVALPFLLQNLLGKSKRIVWSYCKEAIKYNFPLIPYYLSMVLLNNSDRIMIQRIVGESEAAIYGVAYSLSMAIFVFSGAINLALQPWMFKELKTCINRDRTKTFNLGLAFITILNLMLLMVTPELILIVASEKYYAAIWTMPPIISSLIIMFIYQQFLNVHFYFGKNKIVFIASMIAASLNIGLNWLCINWFGYIAAGYTTLISYGVIAILYYFTMKKTCADNGVDYKNYFSMKFILVDCSLYAILTIIISSLYPYPIIRYTLVCIGLLLCFAKREKIVLLCKNSGLIYRLREKIMKKHNFIFISIAAALALIVFITGYLLITARPSNKSIISGDLVPITVLDYKEIIELPAFHDNELGFTCTGLTYDNKRDSFWMGNYGKTDQSQNVTNPSIVQVSKDLKTIKSEIIILGDAVDVQGISYDGTTDTLWYSNGRLIINCSTEGEILKQFNLGKYEKYRPNGVLYDSQTNSLWVLCFYNYLLNFDTEGNLLSCIQSDYIGQDHLCFSAERKLCFSVGNDYQGEDNYVVVCSPETMKIEHAYQVIGSYSIEGICIIGSTLYVANDGYYHEAKISKNYIATYDISD